MIYAASFNGPWIDLAKIAAIELTTTVEDDVEMGAVLITLDTGSVITMDGGLFDAKALASEWMEFRRQEDTGDESKRKRSL